MLEKATKLAHEVVDFSASLDEAEYNKLIKIPENEALREIVVEILDNATHNIEEVIKV